MYDTDTLASVPFTGDGPSSNRSWKLESKMQRLCEFPRKRIVIIFVVRGSRMRGLESDIQDDWNIVAWMEGGIAGKRYRWWLVSLGLDTRLRLKLESLLIGILYPSRNIALRCHVSVHRSEQSIDYTPLLNLSSERFVSGARRKLLNYI